MKVITPLFVYFPANFLLAAMRYSQVSFASDKEASLILISQVVQGTNFAAWLVQWDSHINLSAMEKGMTKNEIHAGPHLMHLTSNTHNNITIII